MSLYYYTKLLPCRFYYFRMISFSVFISYTYISKHILVRHSLYACIYHFFCTLLHTCMYKHTCVVYSSIPKLNERCVFSSTYTNEFVSRIIFVHSCILRDVLQSVLGRHNRGWHERSTLALYPGASFYEVCFFKQVALSSNGLLVSVLYCLLLCMFQTY